MLAPPELKDVHPLGKAPIVSVKAPGQSEPIVLAESAVIFEYLVEYFAPHLVPKKYREGMEGKVGGETESWLRYRYFMHYAEGSLMPLLVTALLFDSECDRHAQHLTSTKLKHSQFSRMVRKSPSSSSHSLAPLPGA